MKTCTKCGLQKALDEFARMTSAPDGKQYNCKACNRETAKAYYAENKPTIAEKARWSHVKARYGLGQAQYEQILESQGGKCAICHTTEPGGRGGVFAVDHDHGCCRGYKTCGECVRGLLCNDCNVGIARFRDNDYLLDSAAKYIKRTRREVGTRLVSKLLGLKEVV